MVEKYFNEIHTFLDSDEVLEGIEVQSVDNFIFSSMG